jgi:hypothetical protein
MGGTGGVALVGLDARDRPTQGYALGYSCDALSGLFGREHRGSAMNVGWAGDAALSGSQ